MIGNFLLEPRFSRAKKRIYDDFGLNVLAQINIIALIRKKMVLILVVLFICSSKKLNHLNSVSSQCARGKSSIARKPEDHPKSLNGKKRSKNVTLQILNFIPVS